MHSGRHFLPIFVDHGLLKFVVVGLELSYSIQPGIGRSFEISYFLLNVWY